MADVETHNLSFGFLRISLYKCKGNYSQIQVHMAYNIDHMIEAMGRTATNEKKKNVSALEIARLVIWELWQQFKPHHGRSNTGNDIPLNTRWQKKALTLVPITKKDASKSRHLDIHSLIVNYIMTRKNEIGSSLLIEEILGTVQHWHVFLLRKVKILWEKLPVTWKH